VDGKGPPLAGFFLLGRRVSTAWLDIPLRMGLPVARREQFHKSGQLKGRISMNKLLAALIASLFAVSSFAASHAGAAMPAASGAKAEAKAEAKTEKKAAKKKSTKKASTKKAAASEKKS